ncbi:MAG: OmpA family protein [Algoriphagus sp.]|uniref:OmpA family protein n=1 Tax=Algoriphagus sp. TaxID=1872435 RepID=UPI00261CA559|nr:OmpA family protein [Algoriphagus sp.]MDG1275863.1 OmpA family protein [Algoriphagus sp.]
MKKIATQVILSAVLIFGSVGITQAQKNKIRYADSLMKVEKNYKTASTLYQQAYAKKPKMETATKVAESYDELRDYDNSYMWWKTAIGYEETSPKVYASFLRSAELSGNLNEAKALLTAKEYSSADSAAVQELLAKRPFYTPIPGLRKVKLEPMSALNSEGSDFTYVKDANGNVYFTSDRGGEFVDKMPGIRIDGRNKIFSEAKQDNTGREYFSVYRQDSTGVISEMISNVPNTYNFGDPYYAKEAGLMFYSVTRGITKEKKNRNVEVSPEIYYSTLNESGQLEGFYPVPFNDSTGYSVMHPFVDEEAKRLYFTSDMPDSLAMGGYDLYYAEYDENMTFGPAINLGPEVNTAGDESHAFRRGNKFYFSSTGHKGMGSMDVFVADYSETAFSNVKNMGTPINSIADDFAYRELDNKEIYLSSNRKGGVGLDDLYQIADLYKAFLARVIDCEGLIISDSYLATLTDKTQGGTVQTYRNGDGTLRSELEPESDFNITISKPGYFSVTDDAISTKGFEGDTIKREYKLIPIPYQLPVYVDIIYYDLDKFKIRDDAKPALDKLGQLMNQYTFLDLLVSSHTDSRASDEYNIRLSNDRAKAVTEYMAQHNISADRIRLEWFGEQNLVNDCGNGKPCSESAHQLNRRSELLLEAFPDPSKSYEIPEELKNLDYCNPEAIMDLIQKELRAIPTIYFDFDKSMLRSADKLELERTAVMLNRMPNLMLFIGGHTDQRGSNDYNEKLSEKRSEVVMEYLKKRGVEENRMDYEWFGETQPVHDCNAVTCTEAMHQLNRRTELKLGKIHSSTPVGRKK